MRHLHHSFRSVLSSLALATVLIFAGCASTAGSAANDRHLGSEVNADQKPSGKTLYTLARILIDQGRYPEAESVLLQLLEDQPNMIFAYDALGSVELHLGKSRDALQVFSKGLEVAPTEPILLNNVGMCHVQNQDYVSALPFFQRAVQTDSQTPRYRANLAMALAMNGNYDEALALYLQLMPAADAHHNMAVLCALHGDADRATLELAAASAAAAPAPSIASPNAAGATSIRNHDN